MLGAATFYSLCGGLPVYAQAPQGEGAAAGEVTAPVVDELFGVELLDRIVAVVDEDPIFLSDLERAEEWAGEPKPSRRKLLEQLIDERVRAHEVDRYGAIRLREEDVAEQLAAAPAGQDRELLERLIRRQMRVLAYVEERLGALVFVSDEAVQAYFGGPLREEMLRRGEALPPFDEVREAIRTLLREQALEQRIITWTAELRERAEIIDRLDRPMRLDRLPPIRLKMAPLPAPPTQPAASSEAPAKKENEWPPIP